MIVVGLSWQWVVFGLRLGWVHTLRYISYASLYDRFSYSSLRSSHFVQPYGYIPIPVIQPPPSNTIDFVGVKAGMGWVMGLVLISLTSFVS